jgi:hypothetical protein
MSKITIPVYDFVTELMTSRGRNIQKKEAIVIAKTVEKRGEGLNVKTLFGPEDIGFLIFVVAIPVVFWAKFLFPQLDLPVQAFQVILFALMLAALLGVGAARKAMQAGKLLESKHVDFKRKVLLLVFPKKRYAKAIRWVRLIFNIALIVPPCILLGYYWTALLVIITFVVMFSNLSQQAESIKNYIDSEAKQLTPEEILAFSTRPAE